MSTLGDYLGQIMSEVAMARMQADLETIRIAELYASHPLLSRMPVPHIRLPDVDLDIPLLIKEAEPPRPGESPRGGASRSELRAKFEEVLRSHLARSSVDLTPGVARQLDDALDARERAPAPPMELAVGVSRLADDFTAAAVGVLKEALRAGLEGDLGRRGIDESALRDDARVAFLQLRSAPPRLNVIVSSAAIREGASSDNVARIRLKLTDQGVEWATVESNGVRRDLLVPE